MVEPTLAFARVVRYKAGTWLCKFVFVLQKHRSPEKW